MVSPLSQVHLVGTWERDFSLIAPRLLNSLPQQTIFAVLPQAEDLSLQAGFSLGANCLGDNKQDGLYFVASRSVFSHTFT